MVRASVKPESQENRLDDSDFEDWDEISADFGTKIVWGDGSNGTTKVFVGTFNGIKMVPLSGEMDADNPLDTARAAELTDKEGEKFYCWLNWSLENVIDNHELQAGDLVRIEYVGEEDTKRGLNKVKKLNIKRKRPDA